MAELPQHGDIVADGQMLGEPALIVRRQNLSGDGRGGLDDQAANFDFYLRRFPVAIET